jgi:cytochrome c oxidase subunit 2
VVFFGILAALFLLAVACSQGKQSTWEAVGPVAEKQLLLFKVLLWTMVAVFVLVEGALLYTLIRYRRRPGQERPPQIHGHTALEVIWTIIPTIVVLGLGIWSVFTLFELDQPPTDQGEILEVTVTGHQWYFEFEYPDADGNGKLISTANELRIPVDRPVSLKLESDDVLHSFWVPKLAGKVDVVPTRQNTLWFMADSDLIEQQLPATYYGQCAELCGLAHAQMRFRVTVLSEEGYQDWVRDYSPPAALTPVSQQGQTLFAIHCSLCHTVNGPEIESVAQTRLNSFLTGESNSAVPGPNLTDLRTRQTLAAGITDLTVENLRAWIRNPEDIKPGNYMHERAALYQGGGDAALADSEIDALIEYLLNLR